MGRDNQKNRLLEVYSEETSVEISKGQVPDNLYDLVILTAEACPIQAIKINETG
jgi:ferredoxin